MKLRQPPFARGTLLVAIAGGLLSGCDAKPEGPRPITKSRTVSAEDARIRWGATATERFGLRPMGPAASPSSLGSSGMAGGSGAPSYEWTTPPGWRELGSTSLRVANFQVAGDPRAECYLTVLAGDGGGAVANLNRWRQQMSLGELSPDEVARLPKTEWLHGQATRIDVEGAWRGMGGDQAESGYRLVGLVLIEKGGASFLKMVGPRDVITAELDAFDDLVASFHRGDHTHGPDAGAAAPSSAAALPERAGGLAWSAPDGWTRAADRPMRVVTYQTGEPPAPECYISVLGGTGGGMRPNLDRWRSQMGQPALSDDEFAALTRVSMLGREGVLIEVPGDFEGMGSQSVDGALLLGAVCNLASRAVYVKLIGPAAVVADQREAFQAFCESLTESN